MEVEVREQPIASLPAIQSIPIAFLVESFFEIEPEGDGGFKLTEKQVAPTWTKNYDAVQGQRPVDWVVRFDVSKWGLLVLHSDGLDIGAAVVARDTAGVWMLGGRDDLAVLWDIRILPQFRRRGLGRILFEAAASWAAAHGCTELKIETQNINVAACRFYEARGCVLREVRGDSYPGLPHEIQMLWYKDLSGLSPR